MLTWLGFKPSSLLITISHTLSYTLRQTDKHISEDRYIDTNKETQRQEHTKTLSSEHLLVFMNTLLASRLSQSRSHKMLTPVQKVCANIVLCGWGFV